MKKLLKHIKLGVIATVLVAGAIFIHDTTTSTPTQVEAASFEWGTVTSSTLSIRKSGSSSSKLVTTVKKGTKLKCLTLKKTWVKVTVNGKTGYAYGSYIATAYGTATSPYKNVKSGTVNSSTLNIRKSASTSSSIVTTISKGTKVQVLTSGTTWVKVKVNGKTGYTQGKYITLSTGKTASGTTVSTSSSSTSSASAKRAALVAYAKKFLGNKYVYGGTSLTNGTDCSGFTMRIFQHFGYSLPRTSAAQRSAGTKVSSLSAALPGDLICYYGHVAIYLGNNSIIHASNAKDGIKISYNAKYRSIASIRRIIK